MKFGKSIQAIAGAILAALCGPALADDTDIYLNVGGGLPEGSEPILIFSLDYRPNLASTACNGTECDSLIAEGYLPASGPYTYFDVLRGTLKKVMEPVEGVRVGLMLNHDNANNCSGPAQTGCSNGSYVAMRPRLLYADDSNGAKAQFHNVLAAIPTPQGNTSHSYQGKELYFELFRYLTGQGIYNGHNGWTDYSTDSTFNLDVEGIDESGRRYSWDPLAEDGLGNYVSPLQTATECTRIFTVNTMFFVANQEDDSDTAIGASVGSGGFGFAPNEFAGAIRYLNDADLGNGRYGTVPEIEGEQNVTSYFLVDPGKINKTTIGYAQAGGTGVPLPLSADPDELALSLKEIFNQVLSVSTTFVSASVPVNVFNRAELSDNVYIALFQVDGDGKPAWAGNLKKLKLSNIDDKGLLIDALGNPAVAGDGRISRDALTFWTAPDELPPADTDAGEIEGRDGRFVERGGAGQRIPGFLGDGPGLSNGDYGARELYYDDGSSLAALNVGTATAEDLQADLDAADTTEALELIEFARGRDIDDEDSDGDTAEARRWIFNDALHSRPLPLNYGARNGYTESNPAIYLAVASNDGFMRFIRNTTTGGAESGREAWAFMPRSVMDNIKALRANGTGTPHPYMVDGSPAAYIDDANTNGTIESGEDAFLYFGLRRGGKAYYALDVSDPENPRYMWSIEKSGDFAELGMTFSTPRVGHVDLGSGPQPVLVFGGGYDTNKDTRGTVGSDDGEGNAIYVVDAETGELIWKARGGDGGAQSGLFEHPDLVDSIPSTVSIADMDGDLLIDRVLVGDTGGNVWRVDITTSDTSNWTLTRLAALGRHAETGKSNDRRFFHRPDIVPTEDANGVYDAVLIGSGDRPDPLDEGGTVANYFYMIKDRNVAPGSATDTNILSADLGDVTDNCLQEGSNCGVDLTHGWKLSLEDTGEKVLSTPVTIGGKVFFTSYIPAGSGTDTATCAPSEGSGRLYALALENGASVVNYDTSTDEADQDPDEATTKSDRSTDLRSPGIPSSVVSLPPNMILRPDLQVEELDIRTRWRTFWYLEEDTDL